MDDILRSLERAMVKQGWVFGDKATRIGSPFEWTENERKPNILRLRDLHALAFYYSMYYVLKDTPASFRTIDHDAVLAHCRTALTRAFRHFLPFLPLDAVWKNHIESQARARTQDYCFLRTHWPDMPAGLVHLDFGAGLGSSAIYSLDLFKSRFLAVEAHPMSYSVQRQFFRHLARRPGSYLDVVACESFEMEHAAIRRQLSRKSYRIRHVPSWHFGLLPDHSVDLVTATFVLNELNHAGILWVLSQAARVLKPGGHFYIRDSFILKPGTHNVEYDAVLQRIGFRCSAKFEIANRHEFFGIPRLYRKEAEGSPSFDEMVAMCLGRFASVASGGDLAYNLETLPKG